MFLLLVRWTLRAALILAATVGVLVNVQYQRQLPALNQDHARLERLVGDLQVGDETKFWVLPLSNDTPEPLVWKWRVYLPAGYNASVYTASGEISADTPRCRGGYNRSSSIDKQSTEFTAIVAVLKGHTDQWEIHTQRHNGRGRISISADLRDLLDSGEFIVDTIEGEGPLSFEADEPVCLLRLRSKTPTGTLDDGTEMYSGMYFYYVPEAARGDFEAMRSGGKP